MAAILSGGAVCVCVCWGNGVWGVGGGDQLIKYPMPKPLTT